MRIRVTNEWSSLLGEVTVEPDEILRRAEHSGADVFEAATALLKQLVIDQYPGIGVLSTCDAEIKKWLKEFASLGRTSSDLTLKTELMKGEPPSMNFDSNIFEEVVDLPQTSMQQRYQRLVGLDDLKNKIRKEASIWLAPESLEEWSARYHRTKINALSIFRDRYPFFILEGDVGTGKTEFAETFGDDIARSIKKPVLLTRVSMKSRGNGVVGEMSRLISKVFTDATNLAFKNRTPVILLLDEADSLAQSREESQMHHEDRAGVNALIQGIDKIRTSPYPVMLVFCTNRVQSLDPAIRRRAAMIHTFVRPNKEQRLNIFQNYLKDLGINELQLNELVAMTGEADGRKYGFTYSDLVTRLIPEAILAAFPNQAVSYEIVVETVKRMHPTPPFNESL